MCDDRNALEGEALHLKKEEPSGDDVSARRFAGRVNRNAAAMSLSKGDGQSSKALMLCANLYPSIALLADAVGDGCIRHFSPEQSRRRSVSKFFLTMSVVYGIADVAEDFWLVRLFAQWRFQKELRKAEEFLGEKGPQRRVIVGVPRRSTDDRGAAGAI